MHETEMERDSCAYYLWCSPHYFVSYVFISLRNASLDEYDFIALYGGKLAHTQPNNAAWKQNRYEHGKKIGEANCIYSVFEMFERHRSL